MLGRCAGTPPVPFAVDLPTAPPDAASESPSGDLRSFLDRVRARLLRHDRLFALFAAIAALTGLALLLPLAALALVGTRSTAFALAAGGGLVASLVVIAAVVLGVIVPLRRWKSDAAVARHVGRREPPVASDLLSSVELDDAAIPSRRGAPSPELIAALIGATAERIRVLDARALVPGRAVRQAAFVCAGIVALHAGVAIAAPGVLADGWRRLTEAPRAPFDGAALTPTPLVGDLKVTLDAPSYTRRPQSVLDSSSGEFRAMPGTRVTLETRSIEPVIAAFVVVERLDGGSEPGDSEHLEMELDGDTLRAEFVVDGPLRYRFQVERPDHKRLVEVTPRHVEIEPDLAPSVQLLAPAEDLDVTSMKRVELGVTAEDDHGISKVELVWSTASGSGKPEVTRKTLELLDSPGVQSTVQAKVVWDLAEVALPPGARVDYHVEVTDGDTVRGPNVGTSRVFHLRVFSPRERHEQNLVRQEEVAEKMLRVLGGRLVHHAHGGDDLAIRDELRRVGSEVIVELGTLVAAFDKDPQADKRLSKDLEAMRGRLDKLAAAEARVLDKLPKRQPGGDPPKGTGARFGHVDKQLIAELEDDVIALADWLSRERMESLLDVADEIAAHRKRLDQLLEEYARTGDPRLKAEIERELRALEQRLAELARMRSGMDAEVLDQFVHSEAMQDKRAGDCFEEVRNLFAAGKVDEAQKKLAECGASLDAAAGAMESALEQLRGDKFADEQQKLDELQDQLADLTQDQQEIAKEADRLFERYADKADQMMEDLGKEAKKRLSSTLDKLRDRIEDVPPSGLTPFAQEELDIVERRLDDLEEMLADGDIAEALGMARQAKQSLDTVSAELEAALEDDPQSQWADETAESLDAVERAHPPADKLIEELDELAPSPDQIMDKDDKKAMEKLRRRQAAADEQAKRLADKARQMAPELPGTSGAEIGEKVDEASRHMKQAEGRMKARDPSAARDSARQAAEALEKAKQSARSAARQQMQDGGAGLDKEPIRIPGADEYRAPEHFREDILEAMKKRAPEGYDEMIKRYYEELIR
jgi:hypothetical protein